MTSKLLKYDSKGKIREWSAEVVGADGRYEVTHGTQGGKLITDVTYAEAMNAGRSNATSPLQQAEAEVRALYVKKVARDGYKANLSDEAKFIAPMLARDYSKLKHQVKTNELMYLSPKLDGLRCIWNRETKTLVSRKGTTYSIPHIEALLQDTEYHLDGELYIHGHPLNEIVSAARKPNDLTPDLQYHVFDIVDPREFHLRELHYERTVRNIQSPYIQAVPQVVRTSVSEIQECHDLFVQQGYEGVMIRLPEHSYEVGVRSKSLYKYKEFEEAEFTIVDVKEGKDGGAVIGCSLSKETVITLLLLNTPADFYVRCRGTDAYRAQQLATRATLLGKHLTVRYQTLTPYGIPQFPVGIAVRDYE